MTNTSFITRGYSSVEPVSMKADLLRQSPKLNWIDGVMVATFVCSFLGLVCLLAN